MFSTLDPERIYQILLFALIINVPFIALNIYYTGKNESCTTSNMIFPPMPFGTWMLIDAIVRCIMLGLLIIIAIIVKVKYSTGQKMFRHYLKLVLVFAGFLVIWMILGMITFWGDFFSANKCKNHLDIYIIIYQIVSLIYGIYVGYTVYQNKIF